MSGPHILPNGESFLAHSHGGLNPQEVSMFNLQGRPLRTLVPSKELRLEPQDVSPDGTRLSLSLIGDSGGIYQYSLETQQLERLTASGYESAWATNDTIVFTALGRTSISSVNVRTKAERQFLSTAPDTVGWLAFSPDRRWLYLRRGPEESDIWMATIK
jgi:hypothetical protein